MQRTVVHRFHDALATARSERYIPRHKIAQRLHKAVSNKSHRITSRRRTEKRQHQVGPGRNAIVSQRQAEVVGVFLETKPFVGRIEEAQQAGGGVYAETSHLAAGFWNPQLKKIIGKARDYQNVVERAADRLARRSREHLGIAARDRMEDPIVNLQVKGEHCAIERLERIALLGLKVIGIRIR